MPLATAAPARAHTDGLAAHLDAAGVLVGRGRVPADGGWQGEPGASDFAGYAVLYPGAGQTQVEDLGALGDPHRDLLYTCQVTCVGATQAQAELIADLVKTAVVGVAIPVAGRVTHPAFLVPGFEVPAQRDDQVSPPEHYQVLQIRFRTVPA